MTTPLQPQSVRNLGVYGLIRQAEVDDSLLPEGAVTEAINFHFDRKGAATVRLGLTSLGTTAYNAAIQCVGLHNAQGSMILAAFEDGTIRIFSINDQDWRDGGSVKFTSSSARIRFADFSGYTLAANGRDLGQFNNYPYLRINWVTGGNPLGGIPANAILPEVYKSRMYMVQGDGNAAPTYTIGTSRLYFSSVISSGGNLTWNTAIDYVDVNPGDGEYITSLKRYSLELLVFKPNYIYRFRTSGLDPDPLIKVGTLSHESVVEGKKGLYFHHSSGFYRYSGGYPVEISKPISDIVSAIPLSKYPKVIAWRDSDHIYWALGNITPPDVLIETLPGTVAWRNVVVRYTESSEVWTAYSLAYDVTAATSFSSIAGTSPSTIAIRPVLGFSTGASGAGNNGVIAVMDTGATDMGEPITSRLVTKWYEWEGIYNRKVINKLVAISDKSQEIHLMYQVDDDINWHEVGTLKKYVTLFDSVNIIFHRIRFKFIGTTRTEAPILRGLEVINGINEGLIKLTT